MTTNPNNPNNPSDPSNPHQANLSHLIARSGIAEDDLLSFVEGDLSAERSAAVIGALAADPELSSLVMGMRSDRTQLEEEFELDVTEPDAAFVGAVVHEGVTGELDPEFAARFEATGRARGDGSPPRMRPTRVVRARRLRFPTPAAGTLLAACVAVAFFGAIYAAWPATPPAPAPSSIAEGGAAADAVRGVDSSIASAATEADTAIADASRFEEDIPEWGRTQVIETPAQALAAALEGRLVIRLYSPNAASGRWLVESITATPSVSRVAVLRGQLTDTEAERIAGSIPSPTGPVFAGDPAGVAAMPERLAGRASWVYMIEVEPTERGMNLLLAGLSRRPGMLVELLRSGEPVTTPGSVSDVSWFRASSRDWTRRIAAPIVVQSGEQ
ncbi:MAG: hypothetical protein AAFO89_06050 [Planctomycetota bacterium]